MPPIDPFELLKCLGVLLTPRGGIKSPNEVDRISRLMLRFSKKLVSKCIYIQILKATQPDLLQLFLNHEGCLLLDAWLSDAVKTNNKALLTEMLQLLEVCPLQDEKFKQTSISSMIQTVAQGNFDPGLRSSAAQLWSRFFCGKPESFATHDTGLPEDIDLSIYAPDTMTSSGDLFNHVVDVPMAETTGLANVNYPQYNQIYSNTVPEPAVSLANSRNLLNSTSSLVHNSQGPIINDTAVQNSVESAVPQTWGTAEPTESTDARLNSEEVSKPVAKGATSPGGGGLPRIKIVTKGGVPYVVKKEPGDENKQESEKVVAKDETEAAEKDKVKSKEKDKEKERERDKKKDKSKEKDREKDRKSSSSSHSKSKDPKSRSDKERKEKESSKSKEKEKTKEKKKSSKDDDKEKKAKNEASKQAEKDRETLAAIKAMASGGGVAKLSKIPRKKSDEKDKEKEKEKAPAVESAQPLDLLDKLQRPKTVKTFNSKFRSTGLEDGQGTKPPAAVKKPPATQATSPAAEKKQKRPSLSDPAASPSEKKPKFAGEKDDTAISAAVAAVMKKTAADTKPAVKLIPPRPRPVLQDSSLFMDALEAGSKLEPRKRKRRASTSKDTPTTPDQLKTEGENAPAPVPTSPVITKPTFKFYQDTLETEEDTKPKEEMEVDEKKEEAEKVKEEVKEEVEEKEEEKDADESGAKREGDEEKEGGDETKTTEGVLVTHVRKRPKKTVRWKSDDELHSYHFFELDENERVNVNKLKFDDMMHAERQNERQAFQIAKTYVDEEVEERPWILYVIDLPPALIVPGAQSRERDIQEARENSTLQALYFKGQILPDYPAEPDPEVPLERTTDPQIMPLDDITGNPESVYDHRHIPWPEPRVPGQYVAPPVSHYPPEPMYQPDYMGPQRQRGYPDDGGPPYYDMGPPAGGPSSRGGGGAWMTSDGSVLPETDNGRYPMGGPSRPGAYDTIGPAGGFRGPGRGFGMEGPRPRFPGAPPRGPPRSQGPRGAGPQPCWHFMRGFCRLENRCKFLHPNFPGPMA